MNQKAIALSKITPPLLSDVIPRRRLFRLLDTGRKRPIIWICGPPGSGKTTLAASYLKDRNLPCLWYRLDEGDDDAGSFFHFMSLAAKKTAPRKFSGSQRQLPQLFPENLLALPIFARRYFQYLYDRLKFPSVIVFDNYHDIPPGSQLHKVIHDGLAEVSSGINIIFTSRYDPPPSLADFRSKGMVEIIPWNVLRLTIKESGAIVKTLRKGLKFSGDAIDILHRRSGGWVAGLLLLLTEELKKKADHSSPLNLETPEVVFDYLAGEVFEKIDDQTKTFLLKTAFLPGMTARMAEGLTDIPDSKRILTYLHNNNLFIEKNPDPEPFYQYHPLFQEFLLSQAKAHFTGDTIGVIQNDAAGILESAGQAENALGLYINAGNWDNAVCLICIKAPALMAQGRAATISTWLSCLPQELIDQTPWLLYWKGVLTILSNQRESQSCFERAYHLFDAQGDAAGVYLSWCGVVNAIFHAFEDYSKFDSWIALLDKLKAKYPKYPSEDTRARVTYTMFLALVYRNPLHPDFHAWAEAAIEIFHHDRDSCLRMEVAFHLVCYHHMSGDFARASLIIEQLRESAGTISEAAPLSLLAWKATEAFYSWLTNSPEECLKAMHEGLQVSKDTGVHHLDYVLLGQGISASLSSGDLPEARRLLKKMASSLEKGSLNDRCFYHFVAAWDALLHKDIPHALEHAKIGLKLISELETSWKLYLQQLMMAQALHENGEDQKADEYLSQAHQFASQSKSRLFEYMCHISRAQFALDRGDEESCLDALKQAMTIGKEKGILNFWAWRPDVIARLCAKALEAGIEIEYVQELIQKRKITTDPSPLHIENWPWPIKVYTLGQFNVVKDGKPIEFRGKAQRKPLDLLKVLITLGGTRVKTDRILESLWPDVDGDKAYSSFTTTMQRLRTILGDAAIISKGKYITLDSHHVWVDVWVFEHLLAGIQKANPKVPDFWHQMEKLLTLYHGPFLEGEEACLSDVSFFQNRLRSRFLGRIHKIGLKLEKSGECEKAIALYQKGLEAEPHAEELYRYLMVCYSMMGRQAEVKKVYYRCRKTLLTALRVEPSRETEKLYQKLQAK